MSDYEIYAGQFTGESAISNSEGVLALSSAEDAAAASATEFPVHEALEREGHYAILKGRKKGDLLYDVVIIETLDLISSSLLQRLLDEEPSLKSKVLGMVRDLRDQLIGPRPDPTPPADVTLTPDATDETDPTGITSEEEPIVVIEPSGPRPVCALVIGHRPGAKGAEGFLNGQKVTEYDYHDELAQMIQKEVKYAEVVLVYRDDNSRGYKNLPRKINNLKPDFVVSLHANAYNKRTSGAETLFFRGSRNGAKLARAIHDQIQPTMGVSDRRTKGRLKGDRGGTLLAGTAAPAIIGEPFFIDNPSDLKIAVEKQSELAAAYARGIDNYAASTSTGRPTTIATRSVKSTTTPGVTHELQTASLSKRAFLEKNEPTLIAMIKGVNNQIVHNYGAQATLLTKEDFWILFNSECGMSGAHIDIHHRHSEGERGLLPLPKNVRFWNGQSAPRWDYPMAANKNVEQFMLYLGHLKNRELYEHEGIKIYGGLFRVAGIEDHALRQARVLSGAVHGYFYYGNYSDRKVPTKAILDGFKNDRPIDEIMKGSRYVHADTTILVNREKNIQEATALV